MNKDKIKWLYRKTAKRYHHCHRYPWESITEYISKLDEKVEWNFPYIRKKSNFLALSIVSRLTRESNSYKLFNCSDFITIFPIFYLIIY